MSELKNRIDFVYIFDVCDGNPNGDPDAGNLPRVDAQTGMGLVTDVCLKRKVRNYVQVAKECTEGYDILVKSKEISGEEVFINEKIARAYGVCSIDLKTENDLDGKKRKEKGKAQGSEVAKAREWMCKHYYDVRSFGAVLSTGPNAGQVRGPIQITFSRSFDPIIASEHSLTVSVARDIERSYNEQIGIQGRKATISYGLYVCHGFISANFAKQTGFSEEDLELFFDALKNMFDVDRSAARGLMSAQKLIVFRHDSALGNAPANKLFDLVQIKKNTNGAPRSFKDYEVTIGSNVPFGVQVEELI
ncbi:MAG: type I-C CRISPR-associated protein Cas7/Csd2 [Bacteroidaceae bacterium]|nr:type I-C CRISPR-associated protein Cas7/Csd2 [Bacteroidaceae bacterium]